jgi:hypothetical protein
MATIIGLNLQLWVYLQIHCLKAEGITPALDSFPELSQS